MIQSSAESEDELCRGAEILFIELPFTKSVSRSLRSNVPILVSQFFFDPDGVARKARSARTKITEMAFHSKM